MIYLFIYL